MTVDLWAALAALLFAAAAATSALARWRRGETPWRITLAARLAGFLALMLALALAVRAQGEPSPFDLRQLALWLGVATSFVGLALVWRHGIASTGPVPDLVVLSLSLAAVTVIHPGGSPLSCVQRWLPFWAYWGLLVLGSGCLLQAGSAAVSLVLHSVVPGSKVGAACADAHRLLAEASLGAVVALGGGLTISVWWSWRTVGSLSAGDPRQSWMGATWLVAGLSLLGWQPTRSGPRMAAALAILAAAMALFGLLAIPDLQYLWSM